MSKNTFSFSLSNNFNIDEDKVTFDFINKSINDVAYKSVFSDKDNSSNCSLNIVWNFLYRDIHHCGVPKIFVIASIDKSLSDIFDSNVFNDKLRADKNNLWVNICSLDIENFENDKLAFKKTIDKNDILVADPKYYFKRYKRHNHR